MSASRFIAFIKEILAVNHGMCCAVLLSLLIHGVLLAYIFHEVEGAGTRSGLADARRNGKPSALMAHLEPARLSADRVIDAGIGEAMGTEATAGGTSPTAVTDSNPPSQEVSPPSMSSGKAATVPGAKVLSTVVPGEVRAGGLGSNISKDDAVFSSAEVSVPPTALDTAQLNDSISALGEQLTPGMHAVRLFIDRQGRVVRLGETGTPESVDKDLLMPLLAAFSSVGFSPARIDGRAVNSWIDIQVEIPDDAPRSSRASDRRLR